MFFSAIYIGSDSATTDFDPEKLQWDILLDRRFFPKKVFFYLFFIGNLFFLIIHVMFNFLVPFTMI